MEIRAQDQYLYLGDSRLVWKVKTEPSFATYEYSASKLSTCAMIK